MKEKELAFILCGHSQYDDKLWGLLNNYYNYMYDINDANIGYDYFNCLDLFLIAGAKVYKVNETNETSEYFTICIDEDKEEEFYKELDKLLILKYVK